MDRRKDIVDGVFLVDGADGAGRDALSAVDAGGLSQREIEHGTDVRVETALVRADAADALAHRTGGDTAAAEDALRIVADHMRSGVVDLEDRVLACVVVLVFDAVFLAELLELTIAGTDAGQAFFSVVGEDQLEGLFAVFDDPRGVGENFHPVAGREHAGCGEFRGAFDFDETHAAGADLVDLFEVAECRDLDGRFMGSLKNCISLGDRHFYSIDF